MRVNLSVMIRRWSLLLVDWICKVITDSKSRYLQTSRCEKEIFWGKNSPIRGAAAAESVQYEHVTLMGCNATKYQNIKASRDILLLYKHDIYINTYNRWEVAALLVLLISVGSVFPAALLRLRYSSMTGTLHQYNTTNTVTHDRVYDVFHKTRWRKWPPCNSTTLIQTCSAGVPVTASFSLFC